MAIEVKNLCHIYGQDTIFEQYALKNVDLTIRDGEFIGLIGHTGSGKIHADPAFKRAFKGQQRRYPL